MPRIDPMTGVPVLTLPEFMEREAEHNGTSVDEEFESLWRDMAEAEEQERTHLREHALENLQQAWQDWQQDDEPLTAKPVRVIELVECDGSWNFRTSSFKIVAVCECDDSRTYRITATVWQSSGSMWEPPDFDMNFVYEEV